MGFLRSTIKNVTKVGLVALAVKVAADNGVWSLNPAEGASLFENLRSTVLPGTIVYGEELPSPNIACRSLGTAWNRNVQRAFGAIQCTTAALRARLHKMVNNVLPEFDDDVRGRRQQSH